MKKYDNFNNYSLITKSYVNTFIMKRKKDIHKGECGRILIIAGSKGMMGAAVLCGRAALRTGAGLVKMSIPEDFFPIIQTSVPEATCITRERSLDELMQCSSVAIGPGLGDDEQNGILVKEILHRCNKPIVIDADGLNLLSNDLAVMKNAKAGIIITPHPGEAARLLKVKSSDINQDRLRSAVELATVTGAVTVLKGAESIVATPEGKTYINTTGNPGMATGGSGDVLTGAIAALLGQGLDLEAAAATGVYLHGLAGDIKAGQIGEYGLIASDIAEMLAHAIKITLEQDHMEK